MPKQITLRYENFIAKMDEQLQSNNCKIWREPQITATREADLFATNVAWSIIRVPIHLLVDYVNAPTEEDFIKFFEEGLMYSKPSVTIWRETDRGESLVYAKKTKSQSC